MRNPKMKAKGPSGFKCTNMRRQGSSTKNTLLFLVSYVSSLVGKNKKIPNKVTNKHRCFFHAGPSLVGQFFGDFPLLITLGLCKSLWKQEASEEGNSRHP